MSEPSCPNVRICDLIFEHYNRNFVWPNQNRIFKVRTRLSEVVFINSSRELWQKVHINLLSDVRTQLSDCPNLFELEMIQKFGQPEPKCLNPNPTRIKIRTWQIVRILNSDKNFLIVPNFFQVEQIRIIGSDGFLPALDSHKNSQITLIQFNSFKFAS